MPSTGLRLPNKLRNRHAPRVMRCYPSAAREVHALSRIDRLPGRFFVVQASRGQLQNSALPLLVKAPGRHSAILKLTQGRRELRIIVCLSL